MYELDRQESQNKCGYIAVQYLIKIQHFQEEQQAYLEQTFL